MATQNIPLKATEINIHKIIDPNKILVSDVKNFSNSIAKISDKLRIIVTKIEKKSEENTRKKNCNEVLGIGTLVIIRKITPDGIDLPAWCTRAIITGYNKSNNKNIAFLLDYGEIIELCSDAFTVIPSRIISHPAYLTEIIRLHNILPTKKMKTDKPEKSTELVIQPKWSPESIDLAKNLINAAEKCYFDVKAIGKSDDKKYGEIYLLINNHVIPLGKSLVQAHVAVWFTPNLFHSDRDTSLLCPSSHKMIEDIVGETIFPSLLTKNEPSCCYEMFVSSRLDCNPLNNIPEAKLSQCIHEVLNGFAIKTLWKLQSYMWPAVLKGFDVLGIAPAKHGKSFAFIVPIASIITKTLKYQMDDHPMALVLCASSVEVIETHSIFSELLQNYSKKIKIIAAYNGCTDRSVSAEIFSGCHIFISTPAFLIRYLADEHHREILKFNYINHLIFDNLDLLIKQHLTTLMEFLGKYTLFNKTQRGSSDLMPLQLVATSRTWSVDIGNFSRSFKNPYICIRSFADAAIFCGVKLRTRLISKEEKILKIDKILMENYRMVRTMIICADNDEAEILNDHLNKLNFDILFINDKMMLPEILENQDVWRGSTAGMYKLLICTDVILSDLNITNVDWLIHYSLQVPSKSTFLFRFSTLISNFKSKSTKAEVTIFIDESNDVQLRGIVDLVMRSGYKFSDEQLKAFENIYMNIELEKKDFALCNNIKILGSCLQLGYCAYRHCVLPDVDTRLLPIRMGNRVKLIITYIHSATHFSARISEYATNDGLKHKYSEQDHADIISNVLHYYANKENRRRIREVIAGGIYGYDKSFDQYERVQIITIIRYNNLNMPAVVDLRCIDTGFVYRNVKVSKLVGLPEELSKAPAFIVEVYLANIQPYDKETEWNIRATECSEQWLKSELRNKTYLEGKVQLYVGNTLWVDPLEVRMTIPHRDDVVNSSLKNHLIKEKHGIANEYHIDMIKTLCTIAGIEDCN